MMYMEFINTIVKQLREKTEMNENRIFFRAADNALQEDSVLVLIEEDGSDSIFYRIYCEGLFREYKQCCNMESLLERLMEGIKNARKLNLKEKIRALNEYEAVKDSLFVRPLNFKNNERSLLDTLYRRNGDIALSVCYKISEEAGALISGKIEMKWIQKWGKDAEEVFREALENTMRLSPPRLFKWEKLFMDPVGYCGDAFLEEGIPVQIETGPQGNCLSTVDRTNGAVTIFEPGVAKRISDLMDEDDLLLAYTSVHEVMVHSANSVKYEELERIVNETIKESTAKEDFLTGNIYQYIRAEDRIIMLPL